MKRKWRVIAGTMAAVLFVGTMWTPVKTVYGDDSSKTTEIMKINEQVELDDAIYIQHTEGNTPTYKLKKGEGGSTVVYQKLYPEFTASKIWTEDGVYRDFTQNNSYCATSPENYISVKAGDVFFIKIYGVCYEAGTGKWISPILFTDDKGTLIENAVKDKSRPSATLGGNEYTVPEGATRMYLTNYNNQGLRVEKKLTLNDKEFDELLKKHGEQEVTAQVNKTYEEYKKNETVYEKLDKAYITFVNDDTTPAIGGFADLFAEKQIPICLATVVDNLMNNVTDGKRTRLDVAREVEKNGGEILSHSGFVITQNTLTDYDYLYENFILTNKVFKNYGLSVNGSILAGGVNYISNIADTEKWVSSYYAYSDLYGMKCENSRTAGSVYYHPRGGFGNYNNDIEKIKESIDNAIAKKAWVVFYWHNTNEVSMETLAKILDYVKSKSKDELEAVTYRDMYERYAISQNNLNKKYPKKPAIVTFTIDDSYKDVVKYIKPVFDKYNFKGSVAVIRDLVQGATTSNPRGYTTWYLNENDVKNLYNDGWEILSHGLDMGNLDTRENLFLQPGSKNPVSSSGYTIEQEMSECKDYLEGLLGKGTVRGFAIPNLYILDEYTNLLSKYYDYAIGSGSLNAEYAHERTKLQSVTYFANRVDDEAQSVAENMIATIDKAIENEQELNIYLHCSDTFMKEINWSNYDCNLEALEIVLKYLYEKQRTGEAFVMKPGEVYGNNVQQNLPKQVVLAKTSRVYNGSPLTIGVKVMDARGNVVPSTEYSVTYKNNIYPGTATVSVKFKNPEMYGVNTTLKNNYRITVPKMAMPAVANCGAGRANVTWKQQSGVSGYYIKYKTADTTLTRKVEGETTLTRVLFGLKEGEKYKISVRAYVENGEKISYGEWSNERDFTVDISEKNIVPAKPETAPKINNIGTTRATVNWKAMEGVTGYVVKYKTDGNSQTRVVNGEEEMSRVIVGLNPKTAYVVTVRTFITKDGKTYYSEWSKETTFSTK